MFEQLVILN